MLERDGPVGPVVASTFHVELVELRRLASSPAVDGRQIASFLGEHRRDDLAPHASMVVSELVTNTVMHGCEPTATIGVARVCKAMHGPGDVVGGGLLGFAVCAGKLAAGGRRRVQWLRVQGPLSVAAHAQEVVS